MSGQIHNLFIKPGHKEPMAAVSSAEAETGQGLVGDASYGREKRQVLIIECETLQYFDIQPGQVRENMTIAGLALAGLPAGSQIQAGQAILEVTGDCAPCRFLEDIRPGLQTDMDGRRGTLCRVLRGGTIQVDDAIHVLPTEAP